MAKSGLGLGGMGGGKPSGGFELPNLDGFDLEGELDMSAFNGMDPTGLAPLDQHAVAQRHVLDRPFVAAVTLLARLLSRLGAPRIA